MARAIWTGVISFGLVSVPVGLYSATEEHEVSFHQFEQGTTDRIRYKRVNERTDTEVEYADIVKGADIGGGHYVMLDQDELDAVAPGRSRSIDIQTFVDLEEIDPIYFQKSYYLGPPDQDTAKTYALLRDAMSDNNKAAIATFVMRGKEYLAAIRADGDVLVLETLYFADEVRDPKSELKNLPAAVSGRGKELKMAGQLINSMAGNWRPADYHDTYTERVNALIAAKGKGAEVNVAEEAPEPTNVIDLMAALQRSVESARGNKSTPGKSSSAKKAAKKNAPAKKVTDKKVTAKKTATEKATTKSKSATKSVATRRGKAS
ncbi:non-homologous end joining protein Ku [Jatrophihabitans sp. DSM 45814]